MTNLDVIHGSTPARTTSAPTAPDAEKLRALAAQFESVLLANMLQQMRSSVFDDGEDGSSAMAPLSDALFAEFGLALARAGGIGLTDTLISPLVTQAGGAPVPAAALSGASEDATVVDGEVTATAVTPWLAGRVSSAYGWRRDPIDDSMKFHRGLDIALPHGQDIPAPQGGTVTFAGELPGYGRTVVIDHGNETASRYAHLSEVLVRPGDPVAAGQLIAKVGATGRATGPHLHFEVIEAGRNVDPRERLGNLAVNGLQ
jgi:murein DD-endopeptidase MepM/ murein hydrolase activator NlpD